MSLITLADYKQYKRITNPEKDSSIGPIVDSINDLIKAYCNRTFIDFYTNPKVETHIVSEGVKTLVLKEIPLIQVVSVVYDGTDITSLVSTNSDYGFVNYEFKKGTVTVTYRGGTLTTPADIKLAALELTDYYVNDEHKQRKSFGGTTVEYYQVTNEWPQHIQYILNAHRDV